MFVQDEALYAMRHSLAHIMATAIQHIWPTAKFGVGPVVEAGFYYDVDLGDVKISEADFPKIETEMKQVIASSSPFVKSTKLIDEAINWAKDNNQPYKVDLLNDLKRAGTTSAKDLDATQLGLPAEGQSQVKEVTFYQNADFIDLCRGPHVANTAQVGAFKLLRVSGAYWRGKETNPQMQRLYAAAFRDEAELNDYLKLLETAKSRDHRRLGQELDLFVFSDMVGAGLPMFTPRGTVMREELATFSNQLRQNFGFQKVWTPHITKKELYETSGHWAKFGSELFLIKSQETSDQLALKPMNCPHHTRIYASKARSYRELPIRYLETTTDYRDEKTGELGGLNRVRSLTQDDSHVFCRKDQIEQEIDNLLTVASQLYETLEMDLRVRLSYRDKSDKYLGSNELWENSQSQLKKAVEKNKLKFFEQEGEAAFYGPKIDFMVTDSIGREHQVATVQLDFVQPSRFKLVYTDEDGSQQCPVMIHSTLLGSIERFLAVYIEHTAGKFPVWLAPEQIRLITVNQDEQITNFATDFVERSQKLNLRVEIDNSNETVGKKIRAAELMKIPYVIVVGDKEIKSQELTPRIRQDLAVSQQATSKTIDEFLKTVANEAKSRVNKSSL